MSRPVAKEKAAGFAAEEALTRGRTLWVANLDAESHWAPLIENPSIQNARRKAPRGGTLPRRVLRRIAAFGSLFRALAHEGDTLWLPAPIEPGRLPRLPGIPAIEISDDSPELTLRRFRSTGAAARPTTVQPWADAPPWIRGQTATIAARVNDRRFAFELGRQLGLIDERTTFLSSFHEIAKHAQSHGLERWVLKARLSASGRSRYVHRDGAIESAKAAIERLLRRHGELLFEPWHERLVDIGVLFHCPLRAEPRVHRQVIGASGAVAAIELLGAEKVPKSVLDTARRVSEALVAAGYRGPAGLDAWRHVENGERRWQFLGEINARWSLGHLTRAITERLASKEPRWGEAQRSRLEAGDLGSFEHAKSFPGCFQPLLLPTAKSDGLWLIDGAATGRAGDAAESIDDILGS